MWARRALGWTGVLVVTSCTFGSLANYDIQECHVEHTNQQDDDCDRLNHGDTNTCTPLQCDATRRCLSKSRDDDRDGDSPTSCGGTDCDDHDPDNFGRAGAAEKCDGRDNNCNGLVDEDVTQAASAPALVANTDIGAGAEPFLAGDNGARMVGGYLSGGKCVQVLGLTTDAGSVGVSPTAPCYFLGDETHLSPTQPIARLLSVSGTANGVGLAFVAKSKSDACASVESLEYRWAAAGKVPSASSLSCDLRMLHVALPSLAQLPGGQAVVLWYQTPRVDAVTDCATAQSAKLVASILQDPAAAPAAFPTPVVVASASSSVRRAATALVPGIADALLVGAPSGNDVELFLMDATGKVTSLVTIPSLANARGVSISVGHVEGGSVAIAVVAELGCSSPTTSAQTIAVSFGTLDVVARKATFQSATQVATGGPGAILGTPAAAWREKVTFAKGMLTEWLVTWIVTDQAPAHVFARRYAKDGKALSPGFGFFDGAQLAAPTADGNVLTSDLYASGFAVVAPKCP